MEADNERRDRRRVCLHIETRLCVPFSAHQQCLIARGICLWDITFYRFVMGVLAGAVREARDQGHAGPDARGQEQQWLSGPGAGAAAAGTTCTARHGGGLGK